jgi:hypothetical protein
MFVPALFLASFDLARSSTEAENPYTPQASDQEQCADKPGFDALQAGSYLTAVTGYQQAASLGDAEAMRRLGDMAFTGKGIAQSYARAIHWYCRAALAGNLEAVNRLAAIELGSWSKRRDAQGWGASCEDWLKPAPQPAQKHARTAEPEVRIEIFVEQKPELYSAPPVFWRRYSPRLLPWRWVEGKSQHLPHKPVRSRAPFYTSQPQKR